MRYVGLFAALALVSSVALADQFNSNSGQGPYGTGNNGWCISRPGMSCSTGTQTQQAPPVNAAPVLPPVGSGNPSGGVPSGSSGSGGMRPGCLGSLNPFQAFNDPDGFGKFLRNCVEQPAYADTPQQTFQLTVGTYDVYTRGYGGEQLRPLGWATISASGTDFQVRNSKMIYLLRPGQIISEGRAYQNIAYQSPPNTAWKNLNPPQTIRYIKRVAGALEYDVYYQNNQSETWFLRQ